MNPVSEFTTSATEMVRELGRNVRGVAIWWGTV